MNLVLSRALLADHDGERRARVRREVLRELPGVEVAEAVDSDTVIRTLERQRFDLAIVRHPLPPDPSLPVVLKECWPEHALLLYAAVESEHTLAEALSIAGDAVVSLQGQAAARADGEARSGSDSPTRRRPTVLLSAEPPASYAEKGARSARSQGAAPSPPAFTPTASAPCAGPPRGEPVRA